MNRKELESFRRMLGAQLEQLERKSEGSIGGLLDVTVAAADPLDRAALESEREMAVHMMERNRKLAAKVKRALQKIDDRSFGVCEECGEDINIAAKALVGLGKALVERHGGVVPDRMEDLVELPDVGRKTANVLLGTWFGKPAIPVDTHVTRLVARLDLSGETDPVRIGRDLMELVEESEWTFASHALIWHGRKVCNARKPACEACTLRPLCPFPAAARRDGG